MIPELSDEYAGMLTADLQVIITALQRIRALFVVGGEPPGRRGRPLGSHNRTEPAQPQPRVNKPLTAREQEIATLISQGQTVKEAARALNISAKTVQRHTQHIYKKLGVHKATELTRVLGSGGVQ